MTSMDRASGVWTVRGVSETARRLAKAEAAAEGKTLGEWVEEAIGLAVHVKVGLKQETVGAAKVSGVTIREVAEGAKYEVSSSAAKGRQFESVKVDDVEEAERPAEPFVMEEIRAKRASRQVCQHGVEKGWNCWQCGGKAVIQ